MGEIPYLADAAAAARQRATPLLVAAIARAIRESGYWQQTVEWRISTETASRIEVETDQAERRWYKVAVRCGGSELVCRTPTLERALEFVGVYEQLIRDGFYTLGWASCATKSRRNPRPGETRP